ncbi:MAG: HEAT repeat domain-containing protein, partial [Planctomycetia bacterium]|nr:HEAT repeat domain-containing protein [Planctomycetia bacterium]
VEALAVLATNLNEAGRSFTDRKGVVQAVVQASTSPDSKVRNACGFTLGVLGGDQGVEALLRLAADDNADVRANAALGLARLGNSEAYDALAELLATPDIETTAASSDQEQSQRYKRVLLVVNALRGVALLIDATGEQPPGAVTEQVEKLQGDKVAEVRSSAGAMLKKINRLAGE